MIQPKVKLFKGGNHMGKGKTLTYGVLIGSICLIGAGIYIT